MERTCDNCKYAIMEDHGYSNYTVEGTDFNCALNVHPDGVFDRFYGENPKFKFAEQCELYEQGNPVEISVEKDDDHTPEEQEVINIRKLTYKLIGQDVD